MRHFANQFTLHATQRVLENRQAHRSQFEGGSFKAPTHCSLWFEERRRQILLIGSQNIEEKRVRWIMPLLVLSARTPITTSGVRRTLRDPAGCKAVHRIAFSDATDEQTVGNLAQQCFLASKSRVMAVYPGGVARLRTSPSPGCRQRGRTSVTDC